MIRHGSTAAIVLMLLSPGLRSEELPDVANIDLQPLSAQARRIVEALDYLGQPLADEDKARLNAAYGMADQNAGVQAIQKVLDPYCLIGVGINPESRVKAQTGPAAPKLVQHGRRVFLVKVHNEAGVTAELKATSPNAAPLQKRSTGNPRPPESIPADEVQERWMDLSLFNDRPLNRALSGLSLEYRIIEIYSRDAGWREARITFNVGQGTQDLGFRSEVDILFDCAKAVPVTLEVLDDDGAPTTASFLIRDQRNRVYPSQSRRLAPDFFFQAQVYRHSGETVQLPPGRYTVEWTRGPEYLTQRREMTVPDTQGHREVFKLKRWTHQAKQNWFSGDHHIHAAGCAHYESPTEGVTPADMMRHILGEDLDVGCVLSWGPCWYAQKQFFEGKLNALSTPDYLMRYDVEVSGFPSSHSGHLCLLRLKEDDYPGTTNIEEWPSYDLPLLKWGKEQGAVVGFSHSGSGLHTQSKELPNYEIPPFNGIGANEYIMDVAHDAVDFISSVDTPAPYELNIWYHTLNCGYRCKISGETDFPCIYGERVGLGRVYVKLDDGKLDFDRWCDGIKRGRSYVSDGRSHLADFAVNDVEVGKDGGELKLEKPGTVTVKVKASAYLDPEQSAAGKRIKASALDVKPYWDIERARVGAGRKVPVEVVVNGKAVAKTEIEADGTVQDLRFPIEIAKSSWVALRVYPSSHTNPIFVVVAGKPIRASRKSAEWCIKSVDQCWTQKSRAIRPGEKAEAKAAFDLARDAYKKVLEESTED